MRMTKQQAERVAKRTGQSLDKQIRGRTDSCAEYFPDERTLCLHCNRKYEEHTSQAQRAGLIAFRAAVDNSDKSARKFRNKPCYHDGERFDSKGERDEYIALTEEYPTVLRQVSIHIGQGKRIRPDFLVIQEFLKDGWFVARLEDFKGVETRDWKNKAAWLKDKTGVEIIVKKKGR